MGAFELSTVEERTGIRTLLVMDDVSDPRSLTETLLPDCLVTWDVGPVLPSLARTTTGTHPRRNVPWQR